MFIWFNCCRAEPTHAQNTPSPLLLVYHTPFKKCSGTFGTLVALVIIMFAFFVFIFFVFWNYYEWLVNVFSAGLFAFFDPGKLKVWNVGSDGARKITKDLAAELKFHAKQRKNNLNSTRHANGRPLRC